MNTLENQFLAGSYSPVGCATNELPAENEKADDKGEKSDSTSRTEPPKKKAKKGDNKENRGSKGGKRGQKNIPTKKNKPTKKSKGRLMVSIFTTFQPL